MVPSPVASWTPVAVPRADAKNQYRGGQVYLFRLQRVLDYRHQLTKNLERELHEMVQCLQGHQADLEQCQVEAMACSRYLNSQKGRAILSAELRMMYRAYAESLDRIGRQEKVVQVAASHVAAKRQELIKAEQGEQILETLKEKGSQQYAADRVVNEQRALDELIISRGYHERYRSHAKDIN